MEILRCPVAESFEDRTQRGGRRVTRDPLPFVVDWAVCPHCFFLPACGFRHIPVGSLACSVDVDLASLVIGPVSDAAHDGVVRGRTVDVRHGPGSGWGDKGAVFQHVEPFHRHGRRIVRGARARARRKSWGVRDGEALHALLVRSGDSVSRHAIVDVPGNRAGVVILRRSDDRVVEVGPARCRRVEIAPERVVGRAAGFPSRGRGIGGDIQRAVHRDRARLQVAAGVKPEALVGIPVLLPSADQPGLRGPRRAVGGIERARGVIGLVSGRGLGDGGFDEIHGRGGQLIHIATVGGRRGFHPLVGHGGEKGHNQERDENKYGEGDNERRTAARRSRRCGSMNVGLSHGR